MSDITKKSDDKIVEVINDPLPDEFTDQMRQVYQMRLRGLDQSTIAKLLPGKDGKPVSQPYVAKLLRKMRKIMAEQARNLDQEVFVGETINVYKEAQYKAWELYALHKNDNPGVAAKALDIIMTAQDKSLKALADVGIIRRAAVEHEHQVKVAPFVEKFESLPAERKTHVLASVIEEQMEDLEEPEPPQFDDDLVEGEYEDGHE